MYKIQFSNVLNPKFNAISNIIRYNVRCGQTCDSGWKKITEVQRDETNVFVNPAKGDRKTD